jgi:hypothetical protein
MWDAAATAYAAEGPGSADNLCWRISGFLWNRLGTVAGLDILAA